MISSLWDLFLQIYKTRAEIQALRRQVFWPQDFLALLEINGNAKASVIPTGLYLLIFTVIEIKTEEPLKHKNTEAHFLFAIRAKMSSDVMEPLENSRVHLKETRVCHSKICLFDISRAESN